MDTKDIDKYKVNSNIKLPAQQKEEFSMNEHDFQNMGLIKPVKFEAI